MRSWTIFVAALAALVLIRTADAQTWDGGGTTNNWTDPFNWFPNALPISDGTATLNFDGTTRLSTVLTPAFDAFAIRFDNAAGQFIIGGTGALTIRGGGITNLHPTSLQTFTLGVTLAADQTWGGVGPIALNGGVATGGHTITIDSSAVSIGGALTGSGRIVKSGPNLLQLSGNNSFSGGVVLNSGTLEIGHNSGLGTGPLTVAGGSIRAQGSQRTIANAVTVDSDFAVGGTIPLVFNGPITVSGNYTLNNSLAALGISAAIGEDAPGRELHLSGAGALTLAGPALTLGTSLRQSAGTITANGLINTAGHTLTQTAGTFAGSLTNRGIFNFDGGTHSGNITNEAGGEANINSNLTLTAILNNAGTLRVGSGRTLTFGSQHLNNVGTIELAGGTLSANASTAFASSGIISGFGTISTTAASLNNTGQINVSGGNLTLASTVAVTNSGTINVPTSRQMLWNSAAAFSNSGLVALAGGAFAGTGPTTNGPLGEIRGSGAVQTALSNAGGLIRASGGTLTIANLAGHNTAGGELRVDNGATLTVATAFNSSGTIVLGGADASLNLSSVTNTGTIRGRGRVVGNVLNSGVVRAEDGTLTFAGGANTNPVAGRLEAGPGAQLLYSQGLATNSGLIALTGGTFDNNTSPLSNAGRIEGYGTLRTGGLTNTGVLIVVDSLNVLGPVTNNATVNTTAGAATRFFGPVSGPGNYTGGGSVVFLNTFSPGASPGVISFGGDVSLENGSNLAVELAGTAQNQYDTLQAAGSIALAGGLDVDSIANFSPQPGDTFKILNGAGGIEGKFAAASLPSIADASWQLVYGTTEVTLRLAIKGDFNFDGTVNAADYTVWRDSSGEHGAALLADGDGNGQIDRDDFGVWKARFGSSYDYGSAALARVPQSIGVVPEPAAAWLLIAALASLSRARIQYRHAGR